MPAGKRSDPGDDRPRFGYRAPHRETQSRVGIEPAFCRRIGQQRPDLRGEREGRRGPIVQRLDPVGVARQQQLGVALVPDRQRKHPHQAGQHGYAIAQVQGEDGFGIAVRTEHIALCGEFGAKLSVVIDFAVVDDCQCAVGGHHRLVAGRA